MHAVIILNNVIFYTIDKLLRGEKPLLTECKQLWDYVYVDFEEGITRVISKMRSEMKENIGEYTL